MRFYSVLFILFCLSIQMTGQSAPTKPRVLIIGKSEFNAATTVTGGGVAAGRSVFGGASGNTVYTEHSETWEAMRRFTEDCSQISLVTDPNQPHDFTVVMDYEKVSAGLLGNVGLYQLATLKPDGSPVFITKKNYLRRLIKPTCEAITKASSKP